MKNKKKLSQYFYYNKGLFFLLIISDFIIAISLVIWSLFMKGLADVAMIGVVNEITKLISFGGFFLLFYYCAMMFQKYCNRSFIKKVNSQIKVDVFNAILDRDINTFSDNNTGKYISILNNDINSIQEDYFSNIPVIADDIITFVVATIALFIYEPLIAVVTLALGIIPMTIPYIVGKKISTKQNKFFNFLEQYNAKIKDIFNGFEVIKSFNTENQTKRLHTDAVNNVENARYSYKKSQDNSRSIQYTLSYLCIVIQLTFSIYLVLTGKITLGIFLGTMQISNYVTNPIREAASELINLKSNKSVRMKIQDILNYSNSESECDGVDTIELLEESTPIVLENLTFGYEIGTPILKNINFKFEHGKKYAIVGNSGSGKSTLVKLIMKYYEGYSGDIIVGNHNLNSIDKADLYDKFSMIHQRVIIFDDTLKNNITMFKDYSDEKVVQAVRAAELQDLIESLPDGIDTHVKEDGNNFSGGEKQRISIARSLLKDTSVIIFDEATSSLDNETGSKIESIIIEKENLTAIVVTHKLIENILSKYDCIIALNHGEITEFGTFEELMSNKGYFYSLYTVNN